MTKRQQLLKIEKTKKQGKESKKISAVAKGGKGETKMSSQGHYFQVSRHAFQFAISWGLELIIGCTFFFKCVFLYFRIRIRIINQQDKQKT